MSPIGALALLGLLAAEAGDARARDAGCASGSGVDAGTGQGEAGAVPDGAAVAPGEGQDARVAVHLRGHVLARGSSTPIVAATVVATAAEGGATRAETNDDGGFDLVVRCGGLVISVRAPGYERLTVTSDACTSETPLSLRLLPRPNLPVYETVVTAKHDQPSVELRGPELVTTPGSLGDPLRTIESLPGVAAVAWPAPIYAIRGSNPGNTGYFLDQLEVPLLFHLALGPSVIHPNFLDSMSFYPGGYPAEYGRYVGGVVTTETRAPPVDRAHASGEVRLYDAGALVSFPLPDGNGAVAAAFRYSYTGALLSLLRNDVHLSYWDYQLRADRKIGAWKLSLLLFGSADDLDYQPDQGFSNDYRLQFHRLSLRARRSLAGGLLSVQLAAGFDHSRAPIVQDTYSIAASAEGVFPRIGYQRGGDGWELRLGGDGQAQWFSPSTNVDEAGVSDLARKRMAVLLGAYASLAWQLGQRLTITPGLRWDSYTIGGSSDNHLDVRLAARLALDAQSWLQASAGSFSQAPSLGVQLPAAQDFGLSLYGLQTSWQGAVGVGTRHLAGAELELNGYLHRYVLTDLRDPTLIRPDPLASDFLVRRDARSYGLEVMLRRPPGERLHGWISYTLSRSERVLGPGVIGPSDWDQRHIVNAVAGYRIAAYMLGARAHYNSGRPVLVKGGQTETFVRLPAFYQLDLRAERHFLFETFTLDVYVEVVNATLTREVFGVTQDDSGAISTQSLRIVLPSLGVRGEM